MEKLQCSMRMRGEGKSCHEREGDEKRAFSFVLSSVLWVIWCGLGFVVGNVVVCDG